MKYFEWDEKKNEWLKRERGVSFENIILAIIDGHVLDNIIHPNQGRYARQHMYIVEFEEYAFSVPYVMNQEKIFLKTIFPSRKYTKQYIEKGDI